MLTRLWTQDYALVQSTPVSTHRHSSVYQTRFQHCACHVHTSRPEHALNALVVSVSLFSPDQLLAFDSSSVFGLMSMIANSVLVCASSR